MSASGSLMRFQLSFVPLLHSSKGGSGVVNLFVSSLTCLFASNTFLSGYALESFISHPITFSVRLLTRQLAFLRRWERHGGKRMGREGSKDGDQNIFYNKFKSSILS